MSFKCGTFIEPRCPLKSKTCFLQKSQISQMINSSKDCWYIYLYIYIYNIYIYNIYIYNIYNIYIYIENIKPKVTTVWVRNYPLTSALFQCYSVVTMLWKGYPDHFRNGWNNFHNILYCICFFHTILKTDSILRSFACCQ